MNNKFYFYIGIAIIVGLMAFLGYTYFIKDDINENINNNNQVTNTEKSWEYNPDKELQSNINNSNNIDTVNYYKNNSLSNNTNNNDSLNNVSNQIYNVQFKQIDNSSFIEVENEINKIKKNHSKFNKNNNSKNNITHSDNTNIQVVKNNKENVKENLKDINIFDEKENDYTIFKNSKYDKKKDTQTTKINNYSDNDKINIIIYVTKKQNISNNEKIQLRLGQNYKNVKSGSIFYANCSFSNNRLILLPTSIFIENVKIDLSNLKIIDPIDGELGINISGLNIETELKDNAINSASSLVPNVGVGGLINNSINSISNAIKKNQNKVFINENYKLYLTNE